jgi:aminopeptidase YwaD
MRFHFLLSISFPLFLFAQKPTKADKKIVDNLLAHVSYLADDKLEGRRAGTKGELLAMEYISKQFEAAGLQKTIGKNFVQEFEVDEGKQIDIQTGLAIDEHKLQLMEDFFPLAWSGNENVQGHSTLSSTDAKQPWLIDVAPIIEANKSNPHFDLEEAVKNFVTDATAKEATAIIFYNSSAVVDNLQFNAKDKSIVAKIPVLYLKKKTLDVFTKNNANKLEIDLHVDLQPKKRNCRNVIGYIDNKAANTVIIGAHYDHLGYGEDHNSMYKGEILQIHNGADDNASGTAALIEVAKLLKKDKLSKNNNYLFIAFSGEELGLFGSKYFVEHPSINMTNVNYMINMDMVGRLNDSSKVLTVGGYGTSPLWSEVFQSLQGQELKFKFDSSGSGPSDHTSFYRINIPVLFLFTGLHNDYHKPSDDFEKINYEGELKVVKLVQQIVGFANNKGKLAFLKTKEAQVSTARFSVSLGVMPDYAFDKTGVRIDGVSEGKLAQKLGLQAGDVLMQLGDYKFSDVNSYMQTLAKFKKGDATQLTIKRGEKEMKFDLVF